MSTQPDPTPSSQEGSEHAHNQLEHNNDCSWRKHGRHAGGGSCYAIAGDRHRHFGWGYRRGRSLWTGNAAFDEYQAEVLQNLRAEREAFRAYREEQRHNRDREAYEGFRAAQAGKPETPEAG